MLVLLAVCLSSAQGKTALHGQLPAVEVVQTALRGQLPAVEVG
jgi:hypothetical protein